jgi:hypothetical protein
LRYERSIALRSELGRAELRQQLLPRSIREVEVAAGECLIENRGAQKTSHLLLLDGIAGHRKYVAAARENGSRHPPLERGEESEGSLVKGNDRIAAAKLNAIVGGQLVHLGRIDRQCVDCVIQFMRRLLRRWNCYRHKETPQRDDSYPKAHTRSVVRFGMKEQGGPFQSTGRN